MQITYSQYLYSCLSDCIDDEWKNLEYDVRFQGLPKLYSWFEESEFNVESKPEYDCIVEYLHARERLKNTLKSHDFNYQRSDDHSVWKRGVDSLQAIKDASKGFSKQEFEELRDYYSQKKHLQNN